MKKRFVALLLTLLCVSLLCGAFAPMAVIATEIPAFNTSVPLVLYDFTTDEMALSMNNIHKFNYEFAPEGYIAITATGDDPSVWLPTPQFKCNQLAYAVICQRTTSKKQGEFYIDRSDGKQMGDEGTNVKFNQDSSGDWACTIADCSVWSDADDSVTCTGFRYDPLQLNVTAGESIDVKYIAFFETEEDAKAFNYEEYLKKLADEQEREEEENNLALQVDWPNPEFKEMTTVPEDTTKGTLTYTYAEDGQAVMISYEVNGEVRRFTVPNTNLYKSGALSAVDDLGRTLYDASQVGLIGQNGKHYVGLFYFLWHGEHGDPGIFDLEKIRQTGGEAALNVNSGLYGPMHSFHWFGEPLYGYYYINDEWVMRKHMELLTNIGVDFLYFDVTNSSIYAQNALKIMKILHELNEQGYDAPEVVFYTNTDAELRVKEVYNQIYAKNRYPDTWFMLNGKPVIVAPDGINYNNFFTVKSSQWPNNPEIQENAWPWMDFEWPQRVFNDEKGKPSAISVSLAQHSGTIMFSDSSLYGDYSNRGRSFYNPEGYASTREGMFNRILKQSYEAWKNDETLSYQGLNFQSQWDYAIEKDVPFVLVTGWNEWIAQRQDGNTYIDPPDADRALFVDTASVEFSRDIEMMHGGYFDNYYIQLAYNIQRLKGAAPVIVQDSRKPINVTGEFDQWADVELVYTDPTGDAVHRDATGFGQTHYVNDTGKNDIVASKITNDTKNLYVYAKTKHDVSMFDPNAAWMQLYINIDSDSTGWYGYDYIINYQAKDAFTTTVAKYNGTDGSYSFESIGDVNYRAKDNELMIAIPLSLLGITDYRQIKLDFKWADSTSALTTMEQFYTDGDCMPLGRLNYVYQTYIPGESVFEDLPEVTQPETVTDSTPTETPDTTNPGCSSSLLMTCSTLLMAIAGAWLLRKKQHLS